MKKHFFLKQVCGLVIGAAGVLVPLGAAQADHDYANRYTNGYLNDPYSNEVAPDTQSVLAAGGAQGPIRDDSAMTKKESFQRDQPIELYTGEIVTDSGKVRGAEGPIRDDSATVATMKQERFEREFSVELVGD